MQLVIDVPEKTYNEVCWRGLSLCPTDEVNLVKAIRNGTPLPKGHGKLFDEKDLSLMTVHMIDGVLVCDAPTIIEADKAGGEVKG